MLIPPDPQRQFVDKPQIKQIYGASTDGDDDHGFGLVDAARTEASNGSASYYAWNPAETPGFRFISIDTNSEGGRRRAVVERQHRRPPVRVAQGRARRRACGEQVRRALRPPPGAQPDDAGPRRGRVAVHRQTTRTDTTSTPAATSTPATRARSTSATSGEPRAFVSLIDGYQNVLAYVPGHTHENKITPFKRQNGTVWWEHQHLGRRRQPAAVAPDRRHGQPRTARSRSSASCSTMPRTRRRPRRARAGGFERQRARLDRPHRRLQRLPDRQPGGRGRARRTRTSSC